MAEAVTSLPNYRRGDTWRFVVKPITDPLLAQIIDYTGRELWFTVKPQDSDESDDSDALIQIREPVSALTIVQVDGADAYLLVVPSDMTGIDVGEYKADIQLVLPGMPPEVDTLIVDKRFKVTLDVTRQDA